VIRVVNDNLRFMKLEIKRFLCELGMALAA
jgi:hypothetical protein